jgi:hypothetical protein
LVGSTGLFKGECPGLRETLLASLLVLDLLALRWRIERGGIRDVLQAKQAE